MPLPRHLRVGVDIGGTFTDLCILDGEGIVAVGKGLTTHDEPAAAVERLLGETLAKHRLEPGHVEGIVHGTTLVTNALIERKGASTALITTDGFHDVVEMAREHRYDLYDLDLELPRPLVPRYLRFGITERVLADGTVEIPLDTDRIAQLAGELEAAGVRAVAVCFLHSYANSTHERAARDVINAAAPGLRVALSSEVNPEIREYERASTTLANVYVQGRTEDYLTDLRDRLRGLGVRRDPLIMLSNGGVATVDTARRFPIRMLESGPAGGALGAVTFGRAENRPNQLAFDMGGTTAKLCVIEESRPLITHTFEVDRVYRLRAGSGLPVRAPVIDMIEIGAGGGSIARVDSLGLLTVGPDSAGSEPGPACYGRGGRSCTVTDADLVLGYLAPERFLAGRMPLDAEAARHSIDAQIAEPMGIGRAEAAWGIHATVNENMANAARVHAVERGHDPTRLALFASGGNGPVHGPGIASALGSESVLIPPAAGVLSTLGFLSAPMSIDLVTSWHAELGTITENAAAEVFAEMQQQGARMLRESGVAEKRITHERSLELRFVGQGSEIEVAVPEVSADWTAEVRRRFTRQYQQRFGAAMPREVEVEVLSWRLRARGPEPDATLRVPHPEQRGDALVGHRDAYFPQRSGYVATPVYDRYRLTPDVELDGPALIEEDESTVVLAPGMRCRVTNDSSIVIDIHPREDQ